MTHRSRMGRRRQALVATVATVALLTGSGTASAAAPAPQARPELSPSPATSPAPGQVADPVRTRPDRATPARRAAADPGRPSLAPADGAYLEGTVAVASDATVAGDPVAELAVDGRPLEAAADPGDSWLSFEVGSNSIEARYGNHLVVNGDHRIDLDDAVSERVTVPIPNEQLRQGANTVRLVTGTIDSSCGVNHDDFAVSDVRLELLGETADGEENEFTFNFGDGDCGSNTSKLLEAELTFHVFGTPGETTGLRADLDTTTLTNGAHELTAVSAAGVTRTHTVRVNNAPSGAPRISPVDGTLVAGRQTVTAAGAGAVSDLRIDGEEPAAARTLTSGTATFAFGVGSNSIEARYFNHLLVNGHQVDLGGEWVDERVEVRFPQHYLVTGENVVTVQTGDINGTRDGARCANADDFDLTDPVLMLDVANTGTVTPVDVQAAYAMGDGTCGSSTERVTSAELRFTIADAETTTTLRTLGSGEAHLRLFIGGNGTETRFGNYVLVNGMRLPLGDHVGETVDLAFPNEWLLPGVNVVELVAGPLASSCGDNYDDWPAREYELSPATGVATVLHRSVTSAGAPVELQLGDGTCGSSFTGAYRIALPFSVEAPAGGLRADVDTAAMADGEHTVSATIGDRTATRTLVTDNSAPTIAESVPASGQRLTAVVALDLRLDDLAGVAGTPEITLDGAPIDLGDPIGSGLTPGEHTLAVRAIDALGNAGTREVVFTSAGVPDVPADLAPASGSTGLGEAVDLSARVAAPGGGEVTATFSSAEISTPRVGFQGTARAVPTTLAITGERRVNARSLAPLAPGGLASPAAREVAFQRYDIDVAGREGLPVLRWEGIVDPERTVALRAWNTATSAWEVLSSARGAVEGETVLTARVPVRHLDDGVVHVLVTGEDPFADDIDAGDPNGFADPASYDFSLVHFTDTQYLSEGAVEQETEEERAIWRAAYGATTEWIAANAADRKISYVAHTGDIIENNYYAPTTPEMEAQVTGEFEVSSQLQGTLDGAGIPNQVIAGNHDNQLGRETGPESRYNAYYGPERYEAADDQWSAASYGGPWQPGDNQNNYVLFAAGGLEFVAVGLSYGVTRQEAAWASSVFERFSDRNGILLSHDYLSPSTNPDGRGAAFSAPDGSLLYKLVVEDNPNVFLVLAGHEHGVGTNLKSGIGATVTHDVVELLADYQFYTVSADRLGLTEIGGYQPDDQLRFGASFLRLLQFDVDRGEMIVDTYSPFLDDFGATEYDDRARYDGTEDNMVLPVDLTSRTTSFTTETLAVFLPQEDVGADTVASGEVATVTWEDLRPGATYAWVVAATSAGGGRTVAEPAVFATERGNTPPIDPPTDPAAPTLSAPDVTVPFGKEAQVRVEVEAETPVEGTVEVRGADGVLGAAPVVDGVATVTLPAGLRPGVHALTAEYSGSGTLPPASTSLRLTVERAAARVTATAAPVAEGDTGTVRVRVDAGGLPVAGSVEVRDERGVVLGGAGLLDGAAAVTLSASLTPGTHRLVAAYSGSDLLAPATGQATLVVAAKSKTASRVEVDGPARVRGGRVFVLRVAVTAGGDVPSGLVRVTRSGRPVARGRLDESGAVRLRVRAPQRPGTRRFRVSYLGSAEVAESSATVSVEVTPRRSR